MLGLYFMWKYFMYVWSIKYLPILLPSNIEWGAHPKYGNFWPSKAKLGSYIYMNHSNADTYRVPNSIMPVCSIVHTILQLKCNTTPTPAGNAPIMPHVVKLNHILPDLRREWSGTRLKCINTMIKLRKVISLTSLALNI